MHQERYTQRYRSYGIWHRVRSIARYLGDGDARSLTMLDLDSVLFAEHDYPTKIPLALIEVGRDIGQDKPAGVIRKLAELAGLPAYVALYTPANEVNPASPDWPDIEKFRIQRLWPRPEGSWRTLTPRQWASALVRIRRWQLRRIEVSRDDQPVRRIAALCSTKIRRNIH